METIYKLYFRIVFPFFILSLIYSITGIVLSWK